MRDQSGHSPTRTATRTQAHTQGNYTVTGGAGAGNTTVNFLKGGMAGWGDVFRSLQPAATAGALAVALSPIVGGVVQTSNRGDYYEITFTPEQEDRLAEWIRSQLNREPGPVRIASSGVALKVISRQYWPWMLGLAAVGGAIAWSVKGGRRGR